MISYSNNNFETDRKFPKPFITIPPKEDFEDLIDPRDIIPLAKNGRQIVVNLDCPHCSRNFDVPFSKVPGRFKCPSCRKEIDLHG